MNGTHEKKKIIIVENDMDLTHLIAKALELLRYDSNQATNGEQAVDLVTAQLPEPIILDIILLELDGLNVVRLIRQNTKRTHSIPHPAMAAMVSRD